MRRVAVFTEVPSLGWHFIFADTGGRRLEVAALANHLCHPGGELQIAAGGARWDKPAVGGKVGAEAVLNIAGGKFKHMPWGKGRSIGPAIRVVRRYWCRNMPDREHAVNGLGIRAAFMAHQGSIDGCLRPAFSASLASLAEAATCCGFPPCSWSLTALSSAYL